MSDIGDWLFGTDASTMKVSTLTKGQMQLLNQTLGMVGRGLKAGATPSQYGAYTPTPSIMTRAFEQAGSLFGTGQDTIIEALTKQAAGVPAYKFNAGQTAQLWNENFAQPLMSSWRENVLPVVRSSYNVPGMRDSSLVGRLTGNAASQYFAQNVQPSLWNAYQTGMTGEMQSLENAAGRQLTGAQMLGQLPMIAAGGGMAMGQAQLSENERILAALRGEEARLMPEANPWLQMAMGLSTKPVMETYGVQGEEGNLGNVIQAAATLFAL